MILNRLKQQKFWYIKRNWRIKNQILAIQLLIITIIFIFVLGIMIISQQIVGQLIKEASNKVFIKQTQQQLNNIWVYKRNFLEVLQFTNQQIQIINHLFRFVDSNNMTITDPVQCLNQPNTNDTYCYNSSQCYGIFGETSEIGHLKAALSLTSLLTTLRPVLDNSQALYFSHSSQAQFYTIYMRQAFYFSDEFKPHSRPWYSNHVNQINNSSNITQIVYGNPYTVFSREGVRVALTSNLLNQTNQFIGVIAKDIDFYQIELFQIIDSQTIIMILNQIGEVIYSKLYGDIDQPIYNIIDEKYSGFNSTDYEQIKNLRDNQPFISNCYQIQSEFLCRKNSKYNDCSIILTEQIENTPYQLVLFKNSKAIKLAQIEQVKLYNDQFFSITLWYGLTIVFFVIAIVIFSSLASFIIFKQLNLLISNTKLTLKEIYFTKIHQKKLREKYLIRSEVVTDLYISVQRLMHHFLSLTKTESCIAEENKKLPIVNNKVKKRLLPIKLIIESLDHDKVKDNPKKSRRSLLFLRGFK